MADAVNGGGGRWTRDPLAMAVAFVVVVALSWEGVLSMYGKTVPGAFDGVIYTLAGVLGGAFGIKKIGEQNGSSDAKRSAG